MKAALIALAVTAVAPAHIRFAILGIPVSLPAIWLVAAAELLAAAVTIWLVVRAIRRFRSSPQPRAVRPARAMP